MPEVTAKITNRNLKLYINNTLHLTILRDEYIGIQSWIDRKNRYCIEYKLKDGNVIETAYDKRKLWENILNLIDTEFD